MCKSKAQGGQRCAAHTRERLMNADRALQTVALTGTPDQIHAARETWFTAASEYASTREGRDRLTGLRNQAAKNGDIHQEMLYRQVVDKGAQIRSANAEAAALIAAHNDHDVTVAAPAPEPVAAATAARPATSVAAGQGTRLPTAPPVLDQNSPASEATRAIDDTAHPVDTPQARAAQWLSSNIALRRVDWGDQTPLPRSHLNAVAASLSDPDSPVQPEASLAVLARVRDRIAATPEERYGPTRQEALYRLDAAMATTMMRPDLSATGAARGLTWAHRRSNEGLRDSALLHPNTPARAVATYPAGARAGLPITSPETWAAIRARATTSPAHALLAYRHHPDAKAREQVTHDLAAARWETMSADEARVVAEFLSSPTWAASRDGKVIGSSTWKLAAKRDSTGAAVLARSRDGKTWQRVRVANPNPDGSMPEGSISPRMVAHAFTERQRVLASIRSASEPYRQGDPRQAPPGVRVGAPSWMKLPEVRSAVAAHRRGVSTTTTAMGPQRTTQSSVPAPSASSAPVKWETRGWARLRGRWGKP